MAPSTLTSYGDPSCPTNGNGEGLAANRTVVWAAPTAAATLTDVASPGCCRIYDLTGSVYLPAGTIDAKKNAAIVITGQAVTYSWNVQSGNHPNPIVTYTPNSAAPIPEVLRLAE